MTAGHDQLVAAIAAARCAFAVWADTTLDSRKRHISAFGEQLKAHRDGLAQAICEETGKPRWESLSEVDAMIAKIAITFDAYAERCGERTIDAPGGSAVTRFKPHGVTAVLGPFNLPGHLPNGHIVPALLAGNTVVFKPSEYTPNVGALMTKLWHDAGLPGGVVNLVQGDREIGAALVEHPDIDGIYFTGSFTAGRAISRAIADHPQRILALEMGGNNPLVVYGVSDLDAAAYHTVLSAYITTGQRCTCARRLIVVGEEADFIARLVEMIGGVRAGLYTDEPEPFMGPVISTQTAERLLNAQQSLIDRGGRSIVEMTRLDRGDALLGPGLIDVTDVADREDEELFGPLLQLIRVRDFDAAIDEANRTAYGLAAALLCDDGELYRQFRHRVRAGVINWNRQTTGASSRLPFGGVGRSGNHRPSGAYAVDYCAFPVASMESERLSMPEKRLPGLGA